MADPIDFHKNGLAKLHQSEEFSDCKLICGPYHFNLHKVILASQSDYFKAAFKHGTFKTSIEGDDIYDEPEIVKLMVEYFYHFDYLRDTGSLPHSTPSLQLAARTTESGSVTQKVKREHVRVRLPPPVLQPQQRELPSQGYIIEHAKVFAIAVKYQIDGLIVLAASKFKDAAIAYWKHDDFAEAIYIVYSSTAEEVAQLRDIVTEILHQHFEDLEDSPEFEAAFCDIPRLTYALLKRSRMGGKQRGSDIAEQTRSTAQQEGHHNCAQCGRRLVRGLGRDGRLRWVCNICW